jgi:hypothetical protein
MTGVADLVRKNRGAKSRRQRQPAVVARAGALSGRWRALSRARRGDEREYCGHGRERGGKQTASIDVKHWLSTPRYNFEQDVRRSLHDEDRLGRPPALHDRPHHSTTDLYRDRQLRCVHGAHREHVAGPVALRRIPLYCL